VKNTIDLGIQIFLTLTAFTQDTPSSQKKVGESQIFSTIGRILFEWPDKNGSPDPALYTTAGHKEPHNPLLELKEGHTLDLLFFDLF